MALIPSHPMEEIYRFFGAALKKHRQKAHMTQADLGNRVGMSRTSITNIERGRQHVSLHAAYELAAAVGKHPHDLLPPPESLTAQSIQARKLEEMELKEHNEALLKKLMEHAPVVREGTKK